jgi:small GTP-binding protein
MLSYDYTFKILLLGDNLEAKQAIAKRYCYNLFNPSERLTIGVDFHVKTIQLEERKIKIQLWDIGGEERFRFLLPTYCLGANGAMLLYDITNSNSLDHIDEYIRIIREKSGGIPIMLIGSKLHLKENRREISREQGIFIAKKHHLSAFAEANSQNGQNIKEIFQILTENVLRSMLIRGPDQIRSSPPQKPFIIPNTGEFIINRYLKLRLENDQTNIYVGNRLFRQCKYLILNLPINKIRNVDSIESIDEAEEILDPSMEGEGRYKYKISAETEFWAHCSNIQMWYEHEYATHLLHRNLAFPLLRALTMEGDPLAKKVFKEEIARRFESGYPSVVVYLINQKYLTFLNKEELETVIESPKFLNNLSKWFFNSEIPIRLFNKLKEKLSDLDCPYCGTKLKESLTQKVFMGKSIKCKYCYTSITRIK